MTKRIFRSLIGISLVVCMIGMTTVFAVLYYYFDDQIINELQSEANYLAVYVEENGAKALQVLPQDFQREPQRHAGLPGNLGRIRPLPPLKQVVNDAQSVIGFQCNVHSFSAFPIRA